MKKLFLDIENTVIDDLQHCNFLEDNCKKIANLIKEIEPWSIDFFTWGWKTDEEIDMNIVNSILVKLGKDPANTDCTTKVLTKKVGINAAMHAGWLTIEDCDRAIQPGMMAEFGISKISCFIQYAKHKGIDYSVNQYDPTIKNPIEYWLIDDLVQEKEELEFLGGIFKIILMNPKDLK